MISDKVGRVSRLHDQQWGSGVPYEPPLFITKLQSHVERPCSHKVLSPLTAPLLSQTKAATLEAAHQRPICDAQRRKLQLLLGRAPRPGQPDRASAPSSLVKRLIFKLLYALYTVSYAPKRTQAPVFMVAAVSSPLKWTACPCSMWSTPLGLCCWLGVDFMDESHAMQVRYVVDRRLIFGLVGAVEQIDACAREPSLRKRTTSVSGYHMPDHASLSMNGNLVR